ncbi:sulfatase family protein [Granulicella aggregans]|uniref:sulfatase family protein n=1 Tax=Granulicella aggregans TaxID=474949 RepID=UPI0021E0C462|nr:sulfatase [Granulicella aggregans]
MKFLLQSRRGFIKTGAAATIASSAGTFPAPATPRDNGRYNIIYLHSHDSGRYLQPYGHSVPTPNLQRLARQGVLFRNMHSAAPTCSPSRAALLTGQSAHASGMLGLAHLGWGLHDYKQHIVHTLRTYGYTSVLAGVQHVAADPKVIGYEQILPHATTSAKDVAPAAVDYLKGRPQTPFFLDIGFFETHREFPSPVDNPDYIQPPAPLPDNSETRRDMAGFHASARVLDKGIGVILNALEDAGLRKNTIIVSTTDHGIAFPDMKCSLRDSGTGVSMILSGPGVFSKPAVSDALLSQIDLFPTLCDALEIPKPAWLTGRSFLPLLLGTQTSTNDAIFAEVNYHAAYEPKRSVRTARWKYIRHFDDRHQVVLPNCDDGPSKSYWLANQWKATEVVAHEELYDLVFDPNEQRSLIDSNQPDARGALVDLRQRLDKWMKDTRDPLLDGPIPLPAGAHIMPQDAESPKELSQYVPKTFR